MSTVGLSNSSGRPPLGGTVSDDPTLDFCKQFDPLLKKPSARAVVEMVACGVATGLRSQGFRLDWWSQHNGRQNPKVRALQWRALYVSMWATSARITWPSSGLTCTGARTA